MVGEGNLETGYMSTPTVIFIGFGVCLAIVAAASLFMYVDFMATR
jgi:hypothetical protein